MPSESATTLRGALKVFGQRDLKWLETVDRQLGRVLSGTDSKKSRHALFGWIDLHGDVPRLVEEARLRAVEELATATGRVRLELLFAVHTTTVVTSFFDEARTLLRHVEGFRLPTARGWHE